MPGDNGQSANQQGTDLRSVANQIEGLLDDQGHFNPNPDQISRGHPDYDESQDTRARAPQRDEKGRFAKSAPVPDEEVVDDASVEQLADEEVAEDTPIEPGDTEDTFEQSAESENLPEAEETDTIQTLAELADALEIPFEELTGQIKHTFRAADEDVTVTLAELTAGYQKDADYRRGTSRLAEERRNHEAEHLQRMNRFEQENASMAQQLNAIEGMFARQFEDPALGDLRNTDPAEWTARREEIAQQVGQIRQVRNQAAQRYQEFLNENLRQTKEREMGYVRERIPDYGDQHAEKARKAMQSLGYADPEIAAIFDHRVVLGVLELQALREENKLLREEKAKAANTVKRIKKDVPKLTKPGKQRLQTRQGIERNRIAKLKERAAKSGSLTDAAAIIETML